MVPLTKTLPRYTTLAMRTSAYYVSFCLAACLLAGCSAAPPRVKEDPVPQASQSTEAEVSVKQEKHTQSPAHDDVKVEEAKPIVKVEKIKPAPPVKKEPPPAPPKKVDEPVKIQPTKPEPPVKQPEVVAEFEGVRITKETYDQTKTEMEEIVDKLNHITEKKDYAKWVSFLSKSYQQKYSQSAMLRKVSDALPVKGIKLKTLKDYFTYVFVPSRQNVRVDDIQFLSPTRVNVIMKHGSNSLLVYCLENISGEWKLISLE